jgi:hypothetical protein
VLDGRRAPARCLRRKGVECLVDQGIVPERLDPADAPAYGGRSHSAHAGDAAQGFPACDMVQVLARLFRQPTRQNFGRPC